MYSICSGCYSVSQERHDACGTCIVPSCLSSSPWKMNIEIQSLQTGASYLQNGSIGNGLESTCIAVIRSVETSPGKKSRALPFFSSVIKPITSLTDTRPFLLGLQLSASNNRSLTDETADK